MGIYTNTAFSGYSSSDYTSVEPFKGDHFNYHELAIFAATESAANQNAFMKAIALQELAAVEQYGNTEVLYESVDVKGIFEKIKAFFKKIIEKVHKILHTFIAKMSSWFGNNKDFAKKYEKEIVKNWSQISNDFEFKGYKFTNISTYDAVKTSRETIKTGTDIIKGGLDQIIQNPEAMTGWLSATKMPDAEDALKTARDHLDEFKDKIRANHVKSIKHESADFSSSMDSKEFTEELFKAFRNGEDAKDDMNKSKVLECYGGSVNGMMSYIKDYDKLKTEIEKSEKTLTKSIDDIISKIDKVENELIKKNREESKKDNPDKKAIESNEVIVQCSSFVQSVLGFDKECMTQVFGAYLQAAKDCCIQAKEIAVKVIGMNKKMTESADYSSDSNTTSTAFGGDFISAVKLV